LPLDAYQVHQDDDAISPVAHLGSLPLS